LNNYSLAIRRLFLFNKNIGWVDHNNTLKNKKHWYTLLHYKNQCFSFPYLLKIIYCNNSFSILFLKIPFKNKRYDKKSYLDHISVYEVEKIITPKERKY